MSLIVNGSINIFVTIVNKIIHRPTLKIPNWPVRWNRKSMIIPRTDAIGPKMPPLFVKIIV